MMQSVRTLPRLKMASCHFASTPRTMIAELCPNLGLSARRSHRKQIAWGKTAHMSLPRRTSLRPCISPGSPIETAKRSGATCCPLCSIVNEKLHTPPCMVTQPTPLFSPIGTATERGVTLGDELGEGGRYRLAGLLGFSDLSSVWLARSRRRRCSGHNADEHRTVAIKVRMAAMGEVRMACMAALVIWHA